MRIWKLGLILCTIGLIGGLVGYGSGLLSGNNEFMKVGIVANIIQVIGLVFIFIDKA